MGLPQRLGRPWWGFCLSTPVFAPVSTMANPATYGCTCTKLVTFSVPFRRKTACNRHSGRRLTHVKRLISYPFSVTGMLFHERLYQAFGRLREGNRHSPSDGAGSRQSKPRTLAPNDCAKTADALMNFYTQADALTLALSEFRDPLISASRLPLVIPIMTSRDRL